MAAGGPSREKCRAETDDNYDPTVDFFSEKFDPLKALYTPGLKPPVKAARTYDNVAKYESVVCKQTSADPAKRASGAKVAPPAGGHARERKWLPHQLPVKSTKRERQAKDIFTRMDYVQGPLTLLRRCLEDRSRVKVYIRHSHGIRGYCMGYITLFDKHMNMVLEDVTEEWTRPKRRKIPALCDNLKNLSISKHRVQPPEIKIIKTDHKTETCRRKLNQIVLRGEHVAIVCVIEETDK